MRFLLTWRGMACACTAALGTAALSLHTFSHDAPTHHAEAGDASSPPTPQLTLDQVMRAVMPVHAGGADEWHGTPPVDMSTLPNRLEQWRRLGDEHFDVLIVGGGCVGTGAAVDAVSRGLKVALVEREDFASGTSSRSTKMIHGGVRYLEKAVMQLDKGQFDLVREALHERTMFFKNAPHLSRILPIITPIYNLYEIPYIYAGLKMYDWVSGSHSLRSSKFIGPSKAMQLEPMIRRDGLKGAVLYYDGQFDDARMNVSLALTAASRGAAVANHASVVRVLKDGAGRVSGARVRDELTGKEINVTARVVINATGAVSDDVKKMDRPSAKQSTVASAGVHIVFDHTLFEHTEMPFDLPDVGLLIPKTEDGRVVFLLPWNNSLLAGTTDRPATADNNPSPSEEDIEYLLKYVNRYFSVKFTRDMVSSAWAGIRPLAVPEEGGAESTASVSREHAITVSPSGLVSITGGKWTTYRVMARDVVDRALQAAGIQAPRASQTGDLKLVGGHAFPSHDPRFFAKLLRVRHGVDRELSMYLTHKYGDLTEQVLRFDRSFVQRSVDELLHMAKNPDMQHKTRPAGAVVPYERLHDSYPFLMCEVDYAVQREYATSVIDVVVNRLRVPIFNAKLAMSVIPRVSERMTHLLGWTPEEKRQRTEEALAYVRKMTGGVAAEAPLAASAALSQQVVTTTAPSHTPSSSRVPLPATAAAAVLQQ